ncbi:GntR family transcriptional regulator [Pseudomonas syringae]|uniref:GntR family transcriptional regulator n=1 Tax=Pseudomonas syringae TaxID=317 RepID=UPI00020987F1|nr:GntR family transcriptional regulator [Pseudomonas syringae]EGH71531.1 transcriptional regulator [Pseudomonas syringae pv. aceris str. M302273]
MATQSDSSASSATYVGHAYDQIRRMTVTFQLRPSERLNESALCIQIGVSRTPLREALNRLASEGFLRSVAGKGFYCRDLNPDEIYQLYQLRKVIEIGGVKLAVERATEEEIEELASFISQTGPEAGDRTTDQLVELDEIFHERLLGLSGNAEMLQVLRNVNAKIQFVRWYDMDRAQRPHTQGDHRQVLVSLRSRDTSSCVDILERHIDRRREQIVTVIRDRLAQIYMPTNEGGGRH